MLDVLFQFGPITIRTLYLFIATGFLLTCFFLIRFALRKKLSVSFLAHSLLWLFLFALITGRLFFVAENWSLFIRQPWQFFFLWDLGFSLFGTFYGLVGFLYFLCRRYAEPFWPWLDCLTLSGIIYLFFLSLGQFFDGSYYGLPTDLPWGMTFDTITIPFATPIHPTQLYAALALLLLFIYIRFYGRRHPEPGVLGTLAIFLTALAFFAIDFLHGLPSLYAKINFGLIAVVSFTAFITCSHQNTIIRSPQITKKSGLRSKE